jgi:hypothetical protein
MIVLDGLAPWMRSLRLLVQDPEPLEETEARLSPWMQREPARRGEAGEQGDGHRPARSSCDAAIGCKAENQLPGVVHAQTRGYRHVPERRRHFLPRLRGARSWPARRCARWATWRRTDGVVAIII